MAVPPSVGLEWIYEDAVSRARRFVASRYPLDICASDAVDYPTPREAWREVWRVAMPGVESEILLAIPLNFPDALPIAYVPSTVMVNIPHLDYKGLLCTFDQAEIAFDSLRPGEVAVGVLEKAAEVWQAGVLGTNAADYQDEFSAYWEQQLSGQCLSLVTIDSVPRTVSELRLAPGWNGIVPVLFADRKADAERWLESVGYSGQVTVALALYLPIAGLGIPPFPATNGELYQRLRRTDAAALECLLNFLKKAPSRPSTVLFSIRAGEGTVLGAWRHPHFLPIQTVMTSRGTKRVKGVRGFRPGTHPAAMEINGFNRDRTVERLAVKRVDAMRLVIRTAGAPAVPWQLPVNLIGCGSVGGFIADGLARSGSVPGLRLVDSDVLTPENTLRHYCGMSDAYRAKAVAVKENIRRHFPGVDCEAFPEDVRDILRHGANELSGASCTIVAVGDLAVERRINSMWFSMAHPPSPCLCFTWVEPHLCGGHAILVRPGKTGCFECLLDASLGFSHCIAENAQEFIRREAGCQSSFVPYSGTDLTAFTSAVTRFFLSRQDDKDSLRFSWVGDTDLARELGVVISPEYAERPSFSTVVHKLIEDDACPVCRHG